MFARLVIRTYRDAFSGLPRDLWLLALVALVNRAGSMVLPFITLYLTVERGFTTEEAGRLVGLYGIGSALGAYLGGWLSDRAGPVRALQTSLALGGTGFIVLSFIRERLAMGVTILAVSLIVEAFRPAVMSAFAERSPASVRFKAFALLRLAGNLGFGIGPAVGGVLALYSYQWLFIGDAVTCWAAAALLVVLPVQKKSAATLGEPIETHHRGPWRDGPFLALMVVVVLLASALFQLFSTFPLYLRNVIELRENAIGLMLSTNACLIVAFEMVLIHSVQNRDRMRLAALGACLLCAGFGLLPFGRAVWFVAFTVVVWTFGEMLVLPVLNVIVADRAGERYRGQYMGIYTMAYSFAFIIAPIVGTWAFQGFGPAFLWHSIGALGMGLGLGLLLLRSRFRSQSKTTPPGPS